MDTYLYYHKRHFFLLKVHYNISIYFSVTQCELFCIALSVGLGFSRSLITRIYGLCYLYIAEFIPKATSLLHRHSLIALGLSWTALTSIPAQLRMVPQHPHHTCHVHIAVACPCHILLVRITLACSCHVLPVPRQPAPI